MVNFIRKLFYPEDILTSIFALLNMSAILKKNCPRFDDMIVVWLEL